MSLSSTLLARWYAQLAAFLESGVALERAIASARGPAVALRERLRQRLLAGDSVGEALERGAPWLPEIDRKLMAAGAKSGRLPEAVLRLAARHEEATAARRRAIIASLYPVFVAHFGVLALPVKLIVVDGDFADYAWTVLRVLVPLWVVGLGAVWAVRRRFRPVVAILDVLPLIGGYRRARAVADLAFVLEAQITAGIRLDIAWLQAAMAAGDRRLEPLAIAVAETVQRGEPVSRALSGRSELPASFSEFWAVGEQTGRIEQSLRQLHRQFSGVAERKLTAATLVYPNLLFAAIAVWVAIQVLGFYAGYFSQFEELIP